MTWLNRIILLFTCIFEIYILYDFFKSFFHLRTAFKNVLIRRSIVITAIFTLFIINSLNNANINLILVPIIYLMFVYYCFEGNRWVKLGYFIIAYSIILGCEFLFVILLKIPSHFVEESSITDLSSMPWQLLALKLLTYILFMAAKQIPKGTKRRMDIKTFFMYLFVPISSLGIMLMTYYSGMNLTGHIFLQSIMVACFAFLLLGNILMFYAFNRYSEQMEIGMQQELIISKQNMDLKYYDQVEVLNEKYKEFIHNTNHYLKAIGQLAIGENGNKILDILNELHIELENNETIVYCKDHTMNAILSERKIQAEKNRVIYDAYVEPGFDLDSVMALDLIIMLGNLLDNAITAAKQCESAGKVIIRIFADNQRNFNVIKIVNDFGGEIKIDNGKLISTKKDKELHGIGMVSVKNTAKKYGGYLEYFIEDRKFTVMLVIPAK